MKCLVVIGRNKNICPNEMQKKVDLADDAKKQKPRSHNKTKTKPQFVHFKSLQFGLNPLFRFISNS